MEQPSRGRAHRAVSFTIFVLLSLCLPGVASAQWAPSSNGAANISNTNTGNVGVGTTAPLDKLHVDGRARAGDFLSVGNGGHQSWKDAQASRAANFGLAVPGQPATDNIQLSTYASAVWTSRMTILNSNGNVGIGTTSPATKLTVTDGSAPYVTVSTDLLQLKRGTANGAADGGVSMVFGNATNGFRLRYGGTSDRFGFLDGGNGEVLSLVNGGNVGVGTTAPTAKLHVAGDIRVDGNINAKYQDVAEWVPSTQKLSAGTVVVLDPERSNQVLASNSAYDTSVAGVVSAQPGIALGEAGEGKVMVATTGRVKVKVDATRAAIKIGDLLVTSDVEGVAMKSEPVTVGGRQMHAPGTIIGKALEPLAGGKGEILVLLSLQ
jgi:hypothetical protein